MPADQDVRLVPRDCFGDAVDEGGVEPPVQHREVDRERTGDIVRGATVGLGSHVDDDGPGFLGLERLAGRESRNGGAGTVKEAHAAERFCVHGIHGSGGWSIPTAQPPLLLIERQGTVGRRGPIPGSDLRSRSPRAPLPIAYFRDGR